MTTQKQSLGARLRAARQAAGLSVRELAGLAHMNHSYLVKLETDQNDNPSADKLQRLAEVLEIEPSELLAYIGVEPSSTLPPARVYLRRKYGLDDDEAAEVARLIEDYTRQRKDKGGGNEQAE